MGKIITIQEGGVAKQLTVDKLKTNLVAGGTCSWVPEDEVQLGTKHISENGTYIASDDGYYGYDQVVINVAGAGTVSGTDPETGEDVVVTADPTTGKIVETTVPHSIRVVTPPYNQYGIYQDGQNITKNGMEVRALLASGDLWDATGYLNGLIPNGELTLNPSTASYDAGTDYEELVGDGINVRGVTGRLQYRYPSSTSCVIMGTWGADVMPSSRDGNPEQIYPIVMTSAQNQLQRIYLTRYNGRIYSCVPSGFTGAWSIHPQRGQSAVVSYPSVNVLVEIMGGEDSVSQATRAILSELAGESTNDPAGVNINDLTRQQGAGSHQDITVSWPRPGDGKVLEASFEILVAPGYTQNGQE